ncbi:hypothetical protein GCM10011350_21590 [Marinomonas arctica]|nr:hypothetical protein GCM10011350_21590 [Marinomonas arctica]
MTSKMAFETNKKDDPISHDAWLIPKRLSLKNLKGSLIHQDEQLN